MDSGPWDFAGAPAGGELRWRLPAHGRPGTLERNHTIANGELRQAGDRVDVELFHDPLAVGLDRSHTYAQPARYRLVALALGDQSQDLPLPGGELHKRIPFSAAADEFIQGSLGDLRRIKCLACGDRFDSAQQLLRARGFGHVPMSAGLDNAQDILLVAVHR